MGVMSVSIGPPVRFVSRKQPAHSPGIVSCECHECSAQVADKHTSMFAFQSAFQVEDNDVPMSHDRLHQAKTAESAVTDYQRPGNWFRESKFDMPKGVFRESRTGGEQLSAYAPTLKRFPLDADVGWPNPHASMTKRLHNPRRTPALPLYFVH